jgi:hypothetical protein
MKKMIDQNKQTGMNCRVRSPNAPLKGLIACLREAASAKAGGSGPTKLQLDKKRLH